MSDPRVLSLEECATPALEACVARNDRSRYGQEEPFRGEPPHRAVWHELLRAAASPDSVSGALPGAQGVRGICVVRTPAWDQEHFGYAVGRIEHLVADSPATAALATEWALGRLGAAGARLVSARVAADDHVAIHALEDAGFRFQEHMLTPWRAMATWARQDCGTTRPVADDDVEAMCRIARATFSTDRFHTDERVSRDIADGLYERWIRSWHDSPPVGGRSCVVLVDGEVGGFFLYRVSEPTGLDWPICYLVLGGVDPRFTGRGVGWTLYCDVLDDVAPDARYAAVTVASRNPAVVNLYAKLGFRLSSGGDVTLHRWADEQGGD